LQFFSARRRLANHDWPSRPVAENGRRHLPARGTGNAIAIDKKIAGRVGWISKLDIRHSLPSPLIYVGG